MRRGRFLARGRRLFVLLVPALIVGALLAGAAPAMASGPFTLRVQISGHGQVKVEAGATQGTCSYLEAPCTYPGIPGNTEVTLLAEPLGEWEATAWFGEPVGESCSSTSSPECTFKITAETVETAWFLPVLPEEPEITSPSEEQVIESPAGEVRLEFTDPDPRAKGFLCAIDSEELWSCSPATSYTRKVSAGWHSFEVVAQSEEAVNNHEPYGSTAISHFEMVIPRPPEEAPSTSQAPFPFPVSESSTASHHAASLLARWKVSGRRTWVRKLVLERLSAGDRVGARCRGGGCSFKKKELIAPGSTLKLTGLFGRHPLMAGAVIQLSVDPPASAPQVIEVKVRAGAKPKIVRR